MFTYEANHTFNVRGKEGWEPVVLFNGYPVWRGESLHSRQEYALEAAEGHLLERLARLLSGA